MPIFTIHIIYCLLALCAGCPEKITLLLDFDGPLFRQIEFELIFKNV